MLQRIAVLSTVICAIAAGPARPALAESEPGVPAPAGSELGLYEQQALARALDRTHLEVEPAPQRKVLRHIHVVNLDVFAPTDGFLQVFNYFHRTSTEEVVRREVLLAAGQTWDQRIVDETARKLRDPIFTTLVVIVPVKVPPVPPVTSGEGAVAAAPAGQVDMLVVTRDVWSLRLNSDFEVQASKLTYLLIAPSENNFLGLRKLAAGTFEMDQGEYSAGLLYIDKNVLGKKLQLSLRGEGIFRRPAGEFGGEPNEREGERINVVFQRPFWSLASRWAGGVSAFHEDHVIRLFRGTVLDTYTVPGDPVMDPAAPPCAGTSAPFAYRQRRAAVVTSAAHQLGAMFKHRFELGHRVQLIRPSFVDGFPADQCLRDNFAADLFPRSERTSELFFTYRLFEDDFARLHDIDTFELPEDVRFGPAVTATLATALEPIGSERTFGRGETSLGWVFPWPPGGLVGAAFTGSTRLDDSALVDNVLQGSMTAATPTIAGWFRLVMRGDVAVLVRDRNNTASRVRLGGDNGLRGFAINEFPRQRPAPGQDGLVRVIGNLELRTSPIRIGFARGGALVFFDAGDATYSFDQFRLHADVGIGLRFLIPQLASLVYRADWALPLEGGVFPGRFIFGAGQIF